MYTCVCVLWWYLLYVFSLGFWNGVLKITPDLLALFVSLFIWIFGLSCFILRQRVIKFQGDGAFKISNDLLRALFSFMLMFFIANQRQNVNGTYVFSLFIYLSGLFFIIILWF